MEKEKPTKSKKNMMLNFLPKAATATVIFPNHPFSSGREKRFHHHHNHKGFSGPIISIIPAEARNRKSSNNVTNQEPTSPKVSCIGQIKQRKKNIKKTKKEDTNTKTPLENKITSTKKSSRSNFRNFFQRGRKFDVDDNTSTTSDVQNKVPSLSHMRKFASGREGKLSNFDWKNVQITPEDHRKYYSDDDREDYNDEDDEEEEVIIPFSATILVGRDDNRPNFDLEPKKEINLGKRRTMT